MSIVSRLLDRSCFLAQHEPSDKFANFQPQWDMKTSKKLGLTDILYLFCILADPCWRQLQQDADLAEPSRLESALASWMAHEAPPTPRSLDLFLCLGISVLCGLVGDSSLVMSLDIY